MTRSWKLWGALGLFLLLGAAYSPSLSFQTFVYDGGRLMNRQPVVKGSWSIHRILTTDYWGRSRNKSIGSYRPFAVTNLWTEYKLLGPSPSRFAISQIFWMFAVCLGVVALAQLLGLSSVVAWLAGLLFAAHPVHTEIVASVAGRADLLMALLFLLALSLHRSRHFLAAPLNIVVVFLGLCSKELFIVFPAVALLLDILLLGRSDTTEETAVVENEAAVVEDETALVESSPDNNTELEPEEATPENSTPEEKSTPEVTPSFLGQLPWFNYVMYGVITGLFFWMRHAMIGTVSKFPHGAHDNPFLTATWTTKLLNAPMLLWRYFELLVMPVHLSPDRTFNAVPLVTSPTAWRLWAGLLLLGGLVFLWTRASSRLRFLLAFAFLTYIPISNLVIAGPIVMADRWLFLVSIPFCIAVAMGLHQLVTTFPSLQTTLMATGAVLVLSWSAITYHYTHQWRSSLSLFAYASQHTPNSLKARYIHGVELNRARKPKRALHEFQAALRIKPNFTLAYFGMADAHEQLGQLKIAEQILRDEIGRVGIKSPNARIRLILFLRRHRRFKAATYINMTIRRDFPHWLRMMQRKYKFQRRRKGPLQRPNPHNHSHGHKHSH